MTSSIAHFRLDKIYHIDDRLNLESMFLPAFVLPVGAGNGAEPVGFIQRNGHP